jgi:hypothetical protein
MIVIDAIDSTGELSSLRGCSSRLPPAWHWHVLQSLLLPACIVRRCTSKNSSRSESGSGGEDQYSHVETRFLGRCPWMEGAAVHIRELEVVLSRTGKGHEEARRLQERSFEGWCVGMLCTQCQHPRGENMTSARSEQVGVGNSALLGTRRGDVRPRARSSGEESRQFRKTTCGGERCAVLAANSSASWGGQGSFAGHGRTNHRPPAIVRARSCSTE